MKISRIYIPSVYVNCYLLIDEPSGALAAIDPGDDISKDLLRFCTDNGWELRAIFLTHGHYDHVGGVSALRRAFPNVPVYLHPADADNKDPLMPTAALGPLTPWKDGDVVKLGNLNIEVLHTPGHTKGSVCLLCRDPLTNKDGGATDGRDALFTGDTLFAGSCGRTDFSGGDYGEIMASLKRLGELEENYNILPGHEGPSTLSREKGSNLYLREAMGL